MALLRLTLLDPLMMVLLVPVRRPMVVYQYGVNVNISISLILKQALMSGINEPVHLPCLGHWTICLSCRIDPTMKMMKVSLGRVFACQRTLA